MIDAVMQPALEPIAIIGIGCRFPGGVTDARSFWSLLCNGVDAIGEVPADRWSLSSFYDQNPHKLGTATTRWGGFLQQRIDEFDAHFFGISPREAAHVDPMQRWLLEVTWEALEDSGIPPERLAGSATAVYIGAFIEDVKIFRMGQNNLHLIDAHSGTGAAMTMVANRLSYVFDLHGPSMALDTACSSSLVAVHLACQSLWNGESSLAIAGGANAMFQPEPTVAESKAGMLSPDGRCKTWDASANGYVRAEGAGVVVLKPLSRALIDGDPLYALVRGTAVNQDGRTVGITVPSHEAQMALMEEACRRAGISPGRIRYVEAHGTGTPVGDPIEANALAAVLATDRPEGDKCIVGSVKTNFGHLEAAAGIAGLIKAALCLKHKQIPPNLHFREPNPQIPLERLCVRVPQVLEPWPDEPGPALASVNSFGFGGTNAHAVLEEAPALPAVAERPTSADRPELITLSARSPEALRALAQRYQAYVGGDSGTDAPAVRDIAYSAALRRGRHEHRLALVVRSRPELVDHLKA
ncbi:MAG: type I polyketide synthase, partial [Chloroflexota bacterium]